MIEPTSIPENFLKLMTPADRARLGKAGRTLPEAIAAAETGAELALQGDIASYLRLHELEYIKPDGRKKSPLPPGWPDFTLCYRGVALGLEVKTITGKLDPDQVARHMAMTRNGWTVHVVRSVADVQTIFRGIDALRDPFPTLLRGQTTDQSASPASNVSVRTAGQDLPATAGPGAQILSNTPAHACPECGRPEVAAMTPRTVYACGSSDYDQRPGTFQKGAACGPTYGGAR